MDLTIPGEQYFYLRAINAAERQKWLVALGTAKACLTDNRTRREKGNLNTLLHKKLDYQVCLRCFTVDSVCLSCFLYLSELQENTEALKTKMSELRLYCDLLLKQVNKIKDSEELGDSADVRFFDELEKIKAADVTGKVLWSTDAALRLALVLWIK